MGCAPCSPGRVALCSHQVCEDYSPAWGAGDAHGWQVVACLPVLIISFLTVLNPVTVICCSLKGLMLTLKLQHFGHLM